MLGVLAKVLFKDWIWFDYSDYENYKPDMNFSAYSIYNTPEVCKFLDDELIHNAIKTLKEYREFENSFVTFRNETYKASDAITYLGFTAPYIIKRGPNGKVICGVEYSFVHNSTKVRRIVQNSKPYKVVYSIYRRFVQTVKSVHNESVMTKEEYDSIKNPSRNVRWCRYTMELMMSHRGDLIPVPSSVLMYAPMSLKRIENTYDPTNRIKTILDFDSDLFVSAVATAWFKTIIKKNMK